MEEARKCYAVPMCHVCLPPPSPLPVVYMEKMAATKKKRAKKAVRKPADVIVLACRACGNPIWDHKPGCVFPNLGR